MNRIPENIRSFNINLSDAGMERPILAAEAGRIFARWANVEYVLGTMASVLIGDAAALAILDGIKARHNQLDAVKAAAMERVQDRDTRDLLKPLFKLVDRAAQPRNELAHSLWGTIPELPDALLLCDQKAMLTASRLILKAQGERSTEALTVDKVAFEHDVQDATGVSAEVIELVRKNIQVWRQPDFDLPQDLLNRTIVALQLYTVAISSEPASGAALQARAQLTAHLTETDRIR